VFYGITDELALKAAPALQQLAECNGTSKAEM
jgi:hypothetical protein